MLVKKATSNDIKNVAELALMLWDDNVLEDLIEEVNQNVCNKNSIIYLACDGDKHIGFAQCSLRFDYVEGTDSSPVGYLEGIFVREEYRNKGIGKLLLSNCEN